MGIADGERRLAAIMFTDIVGYSRISQANERLALELLEEHRVLLRPIFAPHRGTEVKTIGDAFLVEFRSALDAVQCAVEMQKRIRERNSRTIPSRTLELRIGIHVGDVVHGPSDIYGDAVNVASRIVGLAEPGGVCISQQVFDQIRNKTNLRIDKVGDVTLKNVAVPQRVYKIVLTEGAEHGVGQENPNETRRLAVLPFVNISPDPNDEYFADGLTEELIGKLSEVRGLKVIARTSVMGYKRKDKSASEIGAELGVGSLIEGSVRKAGDRIRVSVQLVDARTQEHLWSSNYDSRLDDIFTIQSDVASKVASSLSAGFFSIGADHKKDDTDDVEAYTLYLRAMQLFYENTAIAMRETVTLLQRAISRDPGFARAHAALADAWHVLAVSGYEDFAAMAKKAEDAAVRAVELDPDLAEAHAALAGVHAMLDRFDAALVEAETAVRINPNLSDGYMSLGTLYGIMRTPAEALSMFKRAYELDPLSPGTAEVVASLASWAGEGGLAREILARLKEIYPKDPRIYLHIVDYHIENKDFDEAQKVLDAAKTIDPSEPMIPVSQALLFASSGRRKEAEDALEKVLAARFGNESLRLNAQLWVHAALGNLDEAFTVLMRHAEQHSWPSNIKIDPLYAEMRRDPRFQDFCRKVGIPP